MSGWRHILLEAMCMWRCRKDKVTTFIELLPDGKGGFKHGKSETKRNPVYLNKPRPKFCKRMKNLTPTQRCWEEDCPFLCLSQPTKKDLETGLRAINKNYKKVGK